MKKKNGQTKNQSNIFAKIPWGKLGLVKISRTEDVSRIQWEE